MRAFNPDSYKNEKWLFDTPGVILPEQVKERIYVEFCFIIYLFFVEDD